MYISEREYHPLLSRLTDVAAQSTAFVVALVDLDRFHEVLPEMELGEKLKQMHELIQNLVPSELLYLGRDEFAVVSADHRVEDLFLHVTLAKQALEQRFGATFSAGLAEYPKHGDDVKELLRALEESLYRAKQEGRNRIVFAADTKMKLKSNYYTLTQLDRLSRLAKELNRSEASLLRESLDDFLRQFEQ
ncbi:diguanylate cyclase [Tumebacillus sp. ITR2]|uniref:Diguanylate cyclase n=1 Tax=Tumebacillus amylolyticus TaxID=2801339 RepID=A0ABS1JEV6_9BACL|nr:diguanylate cyclase [Tumebacillus amylolyticus]MBL0388745.1 diguanylate cyclase [Tumebacillus amylolyticus]